MTRAASRLRALPDPRSHRQARGVRRRLSRRPWPPRPRPTCPPAAVRRMPPASSRRSSSTRQRRWGRS